MELCQICGNELKESEEHVCESCLEKWRDIVDEAKEDYSELF